MFWDDRYGSHEDYVYGTQPNDFVFATIPSKVNLPDRAQCLMLAEGEGRNAVYMAQQGYNVVGVDSSKVGLEKAQQLAKDQSVTIETLVADLADYDLGESKWDCIVGIYCHFPSAIREKVLAAIPRSLKPGGYVVLECYTPQQLEFKTGGPPVADLMYTKDILEESLGKHLDVIRNEELVRKVVEGKFHTGDGAVVQFIGRKALHE